MKNRRLSLALSFSLFSLAAFMVACGDDDDDDEHPDAAAPADAGVDGGRPDGGSTLRQMFVATLTGAEEVPAVVTTATGTAELTVDSQGMATIRVLHNIRDATAAHVHLGIGGRSGDVLFPLEPISTDISTTFMLTADQLEALDDGEMYVNVHSPRHPNGEIRGQILSPGEKLYVSMLNNLEAATTSTASGVVSLILNEGKTEIDYEIEVNARVTSAHIHRAPAGSNGGVVFGIDHAEGGGTATVNAAQVADLEAGLWYANVHTMNHRAGELRGQVMTPGAHLFVADLTGAQEVPPVPTATTTGQAMVILDYNLRDITYYVTTTATAVAAHVHQAPGGVSGAVIVPLDLGDGRTMLGKTSTTAELGANAARGLWYVNVHTGAHPNGELRGQLLAVGETLYTAVMSGAEETPPNMSMGTGGFGLIVSADRMSARGNGSVNGLTGAIAAAHIHPGAAGVAGLPLHTLMIEGMELSVDIAVSMDDLMTLDAEGWYVNVHTMMFPNGELRGQLIKK